MEASILLVEDTVSDAELIREAFRDSNIQHKIDLVTDGEAALQLLKTVEDKPHLVLLDLNLPKKSGLEVLREIRHDPDPFLSIVPVIILTNSRSRKDVLKAYTNGCNAYIQKPIGFERLVATIKQTERFWFNHAIMPEEVRQTPFRSTPSEKELRAVTPSMLPPPRKGRKKK